MYFWLIVIYLNGNGLDTRWLFFRGWVLGDSIRSWLNKYVTNCMIQGVVVGLWFGQVWFGIYSCEKWKPTAIVWLILWLNNCHSRFKKWNAMMQWHDDDLIYDRRFWFLILILKNNKIDHAYRTYRRTIFCEHANPWRRHDNHNEGTLFHTTNLELSLHSVIVTSFDLIIADWVAN